MTGDGMDNRDSLDSIDLFSSPVRDERLVLLLLLLMIINVEIL